MAYKDEALAAQTEEEAEVLEEMPQQSHVHEFQGSTRLAEECEDRHNHRFAGVTSMMIVTPDGHIHAFFTDTDFLDHFHQVAGLTGPMIDVGGGKHVHAAESITTFVDGHFHEFIFATLILSPLT